MGLAENRAAVERFRRACADDPLVVAAFLGGSLAVGTADEVADLDVYALTREQDYGRFFERREAFVAAWGDPVFLETTQDFEGFGFDMLHLVFADGVWGELALGHTGNFRSLHGGAYDVLVDKTGMLDGVEFPLYEPSEEERSAATEHALGWFWLDVLGLAKELTRGHLWDAQLYLAQMRRRCAVVLDDRAPLLASFARSDPDEIRRAAEELVGVYRQAAGDRYPDELAAVAERRLRDLPAD
jgi:hypothetical protein